jgi:CheY-like chemotaxis protein
MSSAISQRAKEIFYVLIADDSETARFLIKGAIEQVPRLQIVAEVGNGTEVVAYLAGLGQFQDRQKFPLPDLLLLDLNMPFKDGFGVLEWLQAQSFDTLTVVVLTDSMDPEHLKRALDLGADFFHLKGRTEHDRQAMVLALEEYMLK